MINDTRLTCILYSFKAKLTFAKLSDKTSVFLVFPLSLDWCCGFNSDFSLCFTCTMYLKTVSPTTAPLALWEEGPSLGAVWNLATLTHGSLFSNQETFCCKWRRPNQRLCPVLRSDLVQVPSQWTPLLLHFSASFCSPGWQCLCGGSWKLQTYFILIVINSSRKLLALTSSNTGSGADFYQITLHIHPSVLLWSTLQIWPVVYFYMTRNRRFLQF